ncbi:sushi, von Willebrand factor type A, EGF and pentraxin domain-containing protein 1-like [Ruditapes philippinarum]|uniref:sushi, von Willebrand factor type A, EGF and pentraxin domain-containing protein 1-like n=1 Tax=Ruditapes philippinarum TaxID=129788 RepID=UPI00295BEBAD|nr:sushi, von Willebrand factor type A, EGF and pentraxin domain-containing protein 1-like [Ruditapes philippinarum]
MSYCKWSIPVVTIMWICVCTVGSKENILKRIEIKALIPRSDCNIKQLIPFPVETDTMRCSTFDRHYRYLVPNGSLCQVTRNETVLQFHCVEGFWKLSKGTDSHLRPKRFIIEAIAAAAGVVLAGVAVGNVIYCFFKHGNMKCEEETKKLEAPTYTVCPPSDIQSVYIADKKKKTVNVTWTDPSATDDKAVVSNEQTVGVRKGDPFPGSPNEGQSHTIIYTAKDEHELTAMCSFSFHVKYLACNEPPIPMNGRKVSCPDGYIYGGECTFECFDGYELVGSGKTTCQQNEIWDNSPICKKVTCSPPFTTTNGIVTCDDTIYEFEDDCLFSCDDGFRLNGPSKMTCRANKTWSVDSNNVKCVDDEPPIISCQTTQLFYADRGTFNTSVTWIVPTATDNVDRNVSVLQTSGPELGDILSEGFHSVMYKVTDSAGNSFAALSECTIVLDVKVIKCFTGPTDSLSNSRFMMYNCSDTLFYNGVSCILYCDLNLPLMALTYQKGQKDGQLMVDCPPIDPPSHGSLTTDSINARPLHIMSCQKGYDIPSVGTQFQGRLSCQDSGNWFPLDDFPDCIVSTSPWLNLPMELYYDGDCNDNDTKTQIKEQVLVYLAGVKADIDNSICPDNNTCKIENLDVVCGDTPSRKRKSATSHVIYKRNTYGLIRFNVMKKWRQGDKSTQDAYIDITNDLNSIADKIEKDAHGGIILNGEGLTLPIDGVQKGTPNLFCDPGYKVDTGSLSCKPCPAGFYLDSDSGNCEACKIGEYIDHEGASKCNLCENGYSTLATGTKDISKCLKLCSPGYFSSTTMEQCSACPVGTYQPEKGQSYCLSCPAGKTTSKTNSTSADDCDLFDVFVNGLADRTVIGSFTADNISVFTMAIWLKVHDEINKNVTIYIGDSNGDIVTLRVASEVSIQVESGNVVLTSARLSPNYWTHIICEIDIASGTLRLYVAGSLEVDMGIAIEPSRTVSAGSVELVADSNGFYMSGLVLYGRALTEDNITSLLQTCAVTHSDELFSMSGIMPNIKNGIAITTPTSCDPINECANNPCGNHTCVNMVNDFSCICHGGMTGDLCDVPPDYCINNQCIQGDCQSGNGTYSCTCNKGYSGVFCDIPPVNGGWSQWGEWSGCGVTCGGGLNSRSRNCNNPTPSPYGNDCEGDNIDSFICNDLACPACPQLKRKYGAVVNCHNVSATLQKCNMTCLPDRALANGQTNFVEYTCGESTGHRWHPTDKIPECVEVNRPDVLGTLATVEYTEPISVSAQTDVSAAVEDNLSGINCINKEACSITTTVSSSNQSRNRRTPSTSLTVQFSIKLTDTGDLDAAGYLSRGKETSAMKELLQALGSINDAIEYIQNNTESIFQVTVNGVDYTLENTSVDFVATVTCPNGYAGADGMCAHCPVGTYLVDVECINCKIGTYQPLTGQTECLSCPSGYTTATLGSSDISECSLKISNETDDDDDVDDKNQVKTYNNTTVIIIVVVCVVVVVVVVIVGSACLRKHLKRKRVLNIKARWKFSGVSVSQQ